MPDISLKPKELGPLQVRSLVLGLVIAATLVNIAQFAAIEERSKDGYRITENYGNADLWAIGEKHNKTVETRHAAALALRRFAPGSTLIIPEPRERKGGTYPSTEFLAQMLSVGTVKSVLTRDYDPDKVLTGLKTSPYVIAKTPHADRYKRWPPRRKFRLLVQDKEAPGKGKKKPRYSTKAREFVLVSRGDTDLIVDVALARGELGALLP